jgi:NADH-quinone oxidoreductase subunit N
MSGLELYALLPQIILALGSTLLLMLGAWWPVRGRLMLLGAGLALLAAVAAGACQPPVAEVAGMFSTGPFGRFFTILWSLLAALVLLLSVRYGAERRFPGGEYTSLVLFAAAGMSLLSSASSLVGLFLGLESFTIVLYILIAIDKQCALGTEAGLKYLVMGIVATGLLTFGIALIYVATGSFHLPEAMIGLTTEHGLRPLGLLVGHSRKSFLRGFAAGAPAERDLVTIGSSMALCARGVDILRVHNVADHALAYRGWAHLQPAD